MKNVLKYLKNQKNQKMGNLIIKCKSESMSFTNPKSYIYIWMNSIGYKWMNELYNRICSQIRYMLLTTLLFAHDYLWIINIRPSSSPLYKVPIICNVALYNFACYCGQGIV